MRHEIEMKIKDKNNAYATGWTRSTKHKNRLPGKGGKKRTESHDRDDEISLFKSKMQNMKKYRIKKLDNKHKEK